MVMSMREQKRVLMKKYKEGKLSYKGMQYRLNFGRDIMKVINALDAFVKKHSGDLESYEVDSLKIAREKLVMVREE